MSLLLRSARTDPGLSREIVRDTLCLSHLIVIVILILIGNKT